jgi:murein DD-endopeptidase MepM/ murein hydrolase activator NlpD
MKIIVSESQYNKIIQSVQEQETKLVKALNFLIPDVEDDSSEEDEDSDKETNDESDTVPKDKLTSPLKNFNVTGKFGIVRAGLDTKRPHSGIDMKAVTGTELYSPGYGKVVKSDMGDNGGCGGSIWINHDNGLESRFCHCSKIDVKLGDKVKRGQLIGLTGGGKNDPGRGFSTGSHLHYTLAKNGTLVDPLDYVDTKFYGEKSTDSDDAKSSRSGDIVDKKLDIKNKFKVDIENGPKNHGSRPLGNWESDNAWDMFAPAGTVVNSFTKGFVRYIKDYGQNSGKVYGTGVVISGIEGYPDIFYTHLKNVKLKSGDKVNVGSYIGEISEWKGHNPSGEHVHVGLPFGKHIRDYIV